MDNQMNKQLIALQKKQKDISLKMRNDVMKNHGRQSEEYLKLKKELFEVDYAIIELKEKNEKENKR